MLSHHLCVKLVFLFLGSLEQRFIKNSFQDHCPTCQNCSIHCLWFLTEHSQKELQVVRIPPHSEMKTSDETWFMNQFLLYRSIQMKWLHTDYVQHFWKKNCVLTHWVNLLLSPIQASVPLFIKIQPLLALSSLLHHNHCICFQSRLGCHIDLVIFLPYLVPCFPMIPIVSQIEMFHLKIWKSQLVHCCSL